MTDLEVLRYSWYPAYKKTMCYVRTSSFIDWIPLPGYINAPDAIAILEALVQTRLNA